MLSSAPSLTIVSTNGTKMLDANAINSKCIVTSCGAVVIHRVSSSCSSIDSIPSHAPLTFATRFGLAAAATDE